MEPMHVQMTETQHATWNADGLARISFSGGYLVMAVDDAYGKDLAFEEAEFFAQRYGEVTFELQRRAMLVLVHTDAQDLSTICSRCARNTTLSFIVAVHRLCAHCARDLLDLE